MAQYIDKDALVAKLVGKLNKYKKEYNEMARYEVWVTAKELEHKINELEKTLNLINTLEVKEVELEKELVEWHKEHFKKDGTFVGRSGFYLKNSSQMDIAKHFFELGLAQKGNLI